MRPIFITGTDTEVGKTFFTVRMIHALKAAGQSVMAYKPVASDAQMINGELINDDVKQIHAALNATSQDKQGAAEVSLQAINAITFADPIAPHIAAKHAGQELDIDALVAHCQAKTDASVVLIEGAGGWLTPLDDGGQHSFANLAERLNCRVILVVGMRLGCINHTLLTANQIQQRSDCDCIGWVANFIDPDMAEQEENLSYLNNKLASMGIPLIAKIPYSDHRECDKNDNIFTKDFHQGLTCE